MNILIIIILILAILLLVPVVGLMGILFYFALTEALKKGARR